jgi:hypothetical protein
LRARSTGAVADRRIDAARASVASWFETRGVAALLTMRV